MGKLNIIKSMSEIVGLKFRVILVVDNFVYIQTVSSSPCQNGNYEFTGPRQKLLKLRRGEILYTTFQGVAREIQFSIGILSNST